MGDPSRPRREQDGRDAHAVFMDELVEELGGPVGDVETGRTLLVVEAESEDVIRERLARDSWPEDVVTIENIEPWSVRLRSGARQES